MRAIFIRCQHRCTCGDRCIKKRYHGLTAAGGSKHEFSKRGIHYSIVRANLKAIAEQKGRVHA